MLAVPSYTKILTLGSSYTENALVGSVSIQEKVDGSLFAFGINEQGTVVYRSKGVAVTKEVHANMFDKAVEFLDRNSFLWNLQAFGEKDIYFYCEFLNSPKHNVLHYDRTPKNNLVLFDVLQDGKWQDYETILNYANDLEIDAIPQFYVGEANREKIAELLTTPSYLGREITEGVVIKNYGQNIILGGNVFPLFTKYVRESFKERHVVEWKDKKSAAGDVNQYIASFGTEARWQKAVIHLRESGLLVNAVQDIAPLINEVKRDLIEEEQENIKNFLFKLYIDDITRHSIRGLPQWWKNKLLENLNEVSVD